MRLGRKRTMVERARRAPVPWKLLGLAGLAGVAAGGAVVARRRRAQRDYEPDALRARLHARLAEVEGPDGAAGRMSTAAGRE